FCRSTATTWREPLAPRASTACISTACSCAQNCDEAGGRGRVASGAIPPISRPVCQIAEGECDGLPVGAARIRLPRRQTDRTSAVLPIAIVVANGRDHPVGDDVRRDPLDLPRRVVLDLSEEATRVGRLVTLPWLAPRRIRPLPLNLHHVLGRDGLA